MVNQVNSQRYFGISAIPRLLVIDSESNCMPIRALLSLGKWTLTEVESLEEAHRTLQCERFDAVILVLEQALATGELDLDWRNPHIENRSIPLLVLSADSPQLALPALPEKTLRMPLDVAHRHPTLLAEVLDQIVARVRLQSEVICVRAGISECESRIARLQQMLWEVIPEQSPGPWYTQHYMLERLTEEVRRTVRQGCSLSVVLGAWRANSGKPLSHEQASRLASWTAEQLGQFTRLCDVVGQYGSYGFMILLPQIDAEKAHLASLRFGKLLRPTPASGLPAAHAGFGIASLPVAAPSVLGLLRLAEERLERALGNRSSEVLALEDVG